MLQNVKNEIQRRNVRLILVLVIAATLPCYCVGGLLLAFVPRPPAPRTPTQLPTRISEVATWTPPPSETPFVPFNNATPTGITFISTAVGGDSNPTAISIFPTAPGWNTGDNSGNSSTNLVPFCADYGGTTNPVIRADIPGNAANGATVYCRVVTDSNQIGLADVNARGVISAVDIFALNGGTSVTQFSNPIYVCLQGTGVFLFMDANASPRFAREMQSNVSEGYTCTSVPNAGMVVLVSR